MAPAPGLDPQVGRDFREAVQHLQAGRLAQSAEAHRRVLARSPRHAPSLHNLGLIAFKNNAAREAIDYIRQSLEVDPKHHQAWLNLALMLGEARQLDEAIAACRQCLALQPANAKPHAVLGDLLRKASNMADAVAAYAQSLRIAPDQPAVLVKMGDLLLQSGNADDALACCRRALTLEPGQAAASALERRILANSGRVEATVAAIDAEAKDSADGARRYDELGLILAGEQRFAEAVPLHQKAAALAPNRADLHFHLASALDGAGRKRDALSAYQAALALEPERADGYMKVGALLRSMNHHAAAVTAFQQAVKLDPAFADAHYNLAVTCKNMGRFAEARAAFEQAIVYAPDSLLHRVELSNLLRMMCDWQGLEVAEQESLELMRALGNLVSPFLLLPMPATRGDQLEAGRRIGRTMVVPEELRFRDHRPSRPGERIRIGYLSGDFFSHATAILLVEVLEQTDRERFELVGYCHSLDDGSEMRRRIVAAFDRFVPIGDLSDRDAAQRIHDDGIDILVDLKGYTRNARTGILAYRPAPIQVNYLGYPGTMGLDCVDYIVADAVVAPMAHQEHFSERIVHLPHCYQPNDRQRVIAETPVTRAQFGLPDDAFVFCSFNNIYKVGPSLFDVWMRLLQQVPNSVLWILARDDGCRENLIREAAARGVDPGRLVFASHSPGPQHLARHRLADLFVDSVPCNAHTTASDALWAGLPVLTCLGETFAGRVAASLLAAMDLEELITESLEAYEQAALALARDRERLSDIRRRIAERRETGPLFDSSRYTRNLERAYETMVDIMRAGEAPRAFVVAEPQPDVGSVAEARIAYVCCPLCDGADIPYQIEAKVSDHPLYKPELPPTVKWRTCEDCGHVFTEGYLSQEARDVVLASVPPHQQVGADAAAGRASAARVVERIARHAPAGEWLDVGVGTGALLFTAAEWGYDVVGADPRIDSVEMLLKLGYKGVWNDILDLDWTDRFSVVSMVGSLDQAAFPRQSLAAARRLLRSGGVLFVAGANMDTIVWRILDASGANPYWGEIEHSHIFTRARLAKLLESEGFKIMDYTVGDCGPSAMEIIAVKR
ncbi:tetratricopeptide repeat protein [Hyphomicrobium sp. CS1GBMeth3]|uniref:O-linked N-acetylglucosamine transferase family protein n=1 Tax=Hyphomicrobium sp. CS1GBMeth3 TaxID=1892845 RepID=UPI0009309DFE|nr:tetratricopeptide repeat protein [Hyphomicrobium sp. CS1GBMeth3]